MGSGVVEGLVAGPGGGILLLVAAGEVLLLRLRPAVILSGCFASLQLSRGLPEYIIYLRVFAASARGSNPEDLA